MCLSNVLGKVLEMVLAFPSLLIILKIRVEQWFIKIILVLVTLPILRISTAYAALNILDGIFLVRQEDKAFTSKMRHLH